MTIFFRDKLRKGPNLSIFFRDKLSGEFFDLFFCNKLARAALKSFYYIKGLFSWHRVCHEKRPPVSKILNYSDGLFSWHRVCHEKRPPLCFLQDVSYYLYLTFLIINISLIIIWYFTISFLKTFIFHDFFEKSATRNAFSLKEMTIFFKIAPT